MPPKKKTGDNKKTASKNTPTGSNTQGNQKLLKKPSASPFDAMDEQLKAIASHVVRSTKTADINTFMSASLTAVSPLGVSSSTLANRAVLSSVTMKSLSLLPGMPIVVEVSSYGISCGIGSATKVKTMTEFVMTCCHDHKGLLTATDQIALHPDTLELFLTACDTTDTAHSRDEEEHRSSNITSSKIVSVRPRYDPIPMCGSLVLCDLRYDDDDDSDVGDDQKPSNGVTREKEQLRFVLVLHAAQVREAFLQMYLGAVIFDGMIVTLSFASKPLKFMCRFSAPDHAIAGSPAMNRKTSMRKNYVNLGRPGRVVEMTNVSVWPPTAAANATAGGVMSSMYSSLSTSEHASTSAATVVASREGGWLPRFLLDGVMMGGATTQPLPPADHYKAFMERKRQAYEAWSSHSDRPCVSSQNNDDKTPSSLALMSLHSVLAGHIVYVGDHGVGKSHQLQHWQTEAVAAGVPVVEVPTLHLARQVASNPHHVVQTLKDIARSAINAAAVVPSRSAVVLIDDIDTICDPETVEEASEGLLQAAVGARLVASYVADMLDMFAEAAAHNVMEQDSDDHKVNRAVHILVVATVQSSNALPTEHRRLGRFIHVVEILPPSTELSRQDVLKHMITAITGRNILSSSDVMHTNASATSHKNLIDFTALSNVTHGYTPADLSTVVTTASANAFLRCQETTAINTEDLLNAVRTVRPSAIKSLEISIPKVTWNDIGGSDEAKEALQSCVAWSLGKERALFDALGVKPPRGVLLYGPPGCSKTMLAKALAHESGLSFISVKGPEVFSKWVGDSEKAVRDLFARARAVAPCVVFVDELDGMCGKRGAGGVSDRVISQFLTELDGLPSMSNVAAASGGRPKKTSSDIVFVAATNRPDNIDAAVLRPGRIDKKVHVGLPKRPERLAIAKIGMRGLPISDDVSFESIADRTEGYSGAEVIAVCKEAAFQAIGEDVAADFVTGAHVDEALRRVKPRLSQAEVEWYINWAKK